MPVHKRLLLLTLATVFIGPGLADTPVASGETIVVPRVLVTPINETEVPARETGVLKEIFVQVGQMVRTGDPLAQINDDEAQAQEGIAKAEMDIAAKQAQSEPMIAAAQAAADVAAKNLSRAEEAFAKFSRSLSQSEMDDYRLKHTDANTELWRQQHEAEIAQLGQGLRAQQFKLAQSRTRRHQITAPLSGMVIEVYRRRGEWVVPGQAVVRILPLNRFRVVGFVSADQVNVQPRPGPTNQNQGSETPPPSNNRLSIGAAATLTIPTTNPNQPSTFPGKVTFIDPQIEPESGQTKIWVEVDNKDLRLRPGAKGTLTIQW